jgi:hypothetical protein
VILLKVGQDIYKIPSPRHLSHTLVEHLIIIRDSWTRDQPPMAILNSVLVVAPTGKVGLAICH